jgi:uncharacterized protein involved in exopolysaccharide biosynthesis
MSLNELVRILLRHKKKILTTIALSTLLAAFLVLFKAKQFRSEAKLFVHIGRESVSLDPTATIGQTVSLRTTRETEINSVIEMLNSRGIAEQVVESVGVEELLGPGPESPWVTRLKQPIIDTATWAKTKIMAAFSSELDGIATRRELAVSKLSKNITVRSGELSSVVSISCRAQSPELARKIVAAIIDIYGREHSRVNRIAGSEEFFREQTDRLRKQLAQTNEKLSELKNHQGIGSVEAQFRLLEDQKSDIESQQLQNSRALAQSQARIRSLNESLAKLEPTVVKEWVDGLPNVAADGMRQQLYDLEIREREIRSKYDDSHPYVIAIRRQVEEARKIQGSQHETRTESTRAVNPNWQQLELQLRQEEAILASLIDNGTTLASQHDRVQTSLSDLNAYALQVDELQRDAQLLADSYKTYSTNLEQARIDSALKNQHITNVNVAQAATFLSRPVGPSRKLLTGLGMVLGLLAGVAWAFISEHFDQTFKSAAEVERSLNVPVLISIPRKSKPGPLLIAKPNEKLGAV